jgi:hypothetical protein
LWALSNDARSDILYYIAQVIPVFNEICRRVMNYILSCIDCYSQLMKLIVKRGLSSPSVHSPLGRNAVFCALRRGKSVRELSSSRLSMSFFEVVNCRI